MTTSQIRFNLLLDEMLPRREKYPLLNNYHNVRHIVHDLKKEGVPDETLIKLAKELGRIVVTKNIKHLQGMGSKHKVDIIGVSELLAPEKLDNNIMTILRRRKFIKMAGRFTKITS